MPVATFKFGPFRPDGGSYFQNDEGRANLVECENIIPVFGGYATAPYGKKVTTSAITPTTHSGFYSFVVPTTTSNENRWLIMSNTAAYQYNHSGTESLVTRGGGAYTNTAPQWDWQYTIYGPSVLATNGIDAIQTKLLDSGTFAKNNTITAPVSADPRAKFICSFKDHVFIGDFDLTVGTSGGESYGAAYGSLAASRYANAIWWSATDNPRRFADPATTPSLIGSDFRIFNDGLGSVTGMKPGHDYLFIARNRGMSIITGPPFVKENISETFGCNYANSIVRVGSDIYCWTRHGPTKIVDGRSIELIGKGKVSRYLMQIKNVIKNSSGSHESRIYGAVTLNGDYVYWCVRRFVNSTSNTYDYMVVYSVDEDEFTIFNQPSSIITQMQPIYSYYNPYVDRWDIGEGVSGIGEEVSSGDYFIYRFTKNHTGGADIFFTTSYIKNPGEKLITAWKPKKIRLIYENQLFGNQFPLINDMVSSIDLFPRYRYWGVDRDYENVLGSSNFGQNPQSGTFINCPNSDSNGVFNTENAVSAPMYAIRFNLKDYDGAEFDADPDAILNIWGFEVEYESSVEGAGLELPTA